MLRNPKTSMCLDLLQRHEQEIINIGLYSCQSGSSSEQEVVLVEVFSLSRQLELRREDSCADAAARPNDTVRLHPCNGLQQTQKWLHVHDSAVLHAQSGLCLDVDGLFNGDDVRLQTCVPDKDTQQWTFEHYLEL